MVFLAIIVMKKKKKDGKIFTPKETADRMLHDILGWDNLVYENGRVYWPNVRKHIIDNSCGDGAFLALIVDFYIHNVSVTTRKNKEEIKRLLETYIHGIEQPVITDSNCEEGDTEIQINYTTKIWDRIYEKRLILKKDTES